MFSEISAKIVAIAKDETLRKRILFVFFALIVFRVLAAIPIPGVDTLALEEFFANNQFLGLLNIFSGGGLSNLSIVMLGVAPYITASIIMQLLTVMVPKLKALYSEEGEAGKKKFTQYSRLLTVPLAIMQSFGFLMILQRQGILLDLGMFELILNMLIVTGGSILLMWIGELITEFGIGNGVSLIIFAGIVAGLPTTLQQLLFTFDVSQIPLYLGFVVAAVLVIAGVVIVTEAERPIPITYARRVRGMKTYGGISTYLPLRVNQAGVMPIIFALSILLFPQMILSFFAETGSGFIQSVSSFFNNILNNGWIYAALYFILVFLFTYFYTAVTFDPHQISKNLQKSGAFIPGVRPGQNTSDYIGNILTRLTLVGAIFLGLIAVLPLGMQAATNVSAFAIGGTALLIAVSVILDLVRRIESQLSIREY
jgi:preprotein translocase subunit SecY